MSMRRPTRIIRLAAGVGVVVVVVLAGCGQPRPLDGLWVDARPYHADRPAADALHSRARVTAPVPAVNPTGGLTLADAVGLALRHNPTLAAAGWEVAAAEADATQAGRPPNPRAGYAAENWAGPDADDTFVRHTLRFSQVIELGGKRAKRLALGEATRRLRAWDYEQHRVDLAATTTARYVAVVVAQHRLALAEEQLELAEAGYAIADDRVSNGNAPGLERDRASARVALSRIAVEQARQGLAGDRADLAAVWGAAEPAFGSASGELDARGDVPPLAVLRQRLGQSPRVARWDAELDQRRQAWELERARGVADPAVGAGVRYFPDAEDIAGVVELSVPLQVFDDNRHAVLAARLRIGRAHAQRQAAVAEANRTLARAHARLAAASFALDALDEQALPASRAAYDASLDAYRAGVSDYLTVLDAERTLLETEQSRLDALRDYHLAVTELERITAQPIDGGPPLP